jgi:hypothetical protein
MRLTDLEPRWVAINRWDDSNGTQHYYDQPPRRGGISFNCPLHSEKCTCCGQFLPKTHRLVVYFANPVDGLPPQVTDHLWQRDGDDFETLSLLPSIDASKHVVDGVVCWHGSITKGEIR